MKKSILAITFLLSINSINAQKIAEKEVPQAVKAAFKSRYTNIKKVKWEKEKGNYEAAFKINNLEQSLLLNDHGNILEIEVEIKTSELPTRAQEYVAKKYAGQKIKEVSKITDAKGTVTYETEIKDKDIIFDSDGNFLRIDGQ